MLLGRRAVKLGPFQRIQKTWISTVTADSKYAEKLQKHAEKNGISVEQLKTSAKDKLAEQHQKEKLQLQATIPKKLKVTASTTSPPPTPRRQERKDSSPIQPLDSILNLPRILATPHSFAQISGLWTAYHVSRSGGTGRGYICAAIPLELYKKMLANAQQYSSFVVPLPRTTEGVQEMAYEFHFLQWDFHGSPPVPSATEPDLFTPPSTAENSTNPPTSTVLFTPLQEYKMRQSFATPYLVLTHYTDLAHSHGIILMRGEITASTTDNMSIAKDGRYLLNQEDAQLLAVNVQKYYLWGQGSGRVVDMEGERLLKIFHSNPGKFDWNELLKHDQATS